MLMPAGMEVSSPRALRIKAARAKTLGCIPRTLGAAVRAAVLVGHRRVSRGIRALQRFLISGAGHKPYRAGCDFPPRSAPQGGEQVADLVVDFRRRVHGRGDGLANEVAIAAAKAVDGHLHRPFGGAEAHGQVGVGHGPGAIGQEILSASNAAPGRIPRTRA